MIGQGGALTRRWRPSRGWSGCCDDVEAERVGQRHQRDEHQPSGQRLTRRQQDGTLVTTLFDDLGQPTQRRRTPGGTGTDIVTSYTYDVRGNRTADSPGEGTYAYNARDQLTSWTRGSDFTDGGTAGWTMSYIRNPDGSTKQTVPITWGRPRPRAAYSYLGTSPKISRQQEPTPSGSSAISYDYDSSGLPLAVTQQASGSASASTNTLATDANGDPTGLESSTGVVAVADRYVYDPYGNLAANPTQVAGSASATNPLRFEGFDYDSAVKTYDMQARDYRPEIGRFLQNDRYESAESDLSLVADPLTQDRYDFAGGDPVDSIEFDGHRADCGGTVCPSGRAPTKSEQARSKTQGAQDEESASQTEAQVHAPLCPSSASCAPKPVAQPKKDGGGGFHPLKSAESYLSDKADSVAAAASSVVDAVRPTPCQGASLPGVGKECIAGTFQIGPSPTNPGPEPLEGQVRDGLLIAAAAAADSGAGAGGSELGPIGAAKGETDLLAAAREARDTKAAEVGRSKATVTGGYDPATGRVVVGCNRNPTGRAEDDVARQLGMPAGDVRFTEAVRPRTGEQVPVCARWQSKYGEHQFPPGTVFGPLG